MSVSMRLECDEHDCPHQLWSYTTTTWVLRLTATEHGWSIDEYGDYCPIHLEVTDA